MTTPPSPPPSGTATARRQQLLGQLWEMNVRSADASLSVLRTRLLGVFCLISLVVNTLYAAATSTLGNRGELGVSLLTLAILISVLVITLHSGWRRWTAHLYLFSAVLSLLLYIVVNGEAHSSITIWIPFIPMLGLLLLDRKDGVVLTLVYAAIISITALVVEHLALNETYAQTFLRIAPTLFAIFVTSIATLGVILVYMHMRDLIAERQRQEREAKETLLRILSHDIGNNLTVLRLNASAKPSSPEAFARFTDAIRAAADGIIEMVDSVRAMRALEDGKLAVRMGPVDVAAAIDKAVQPLQNRIEQKQLHLDLHLPPTPVTVIADRVTLEQTVIANLLSNAIKFTPPGGRLGIDVSVDAATATLRFWDHGIGIPAPLIPDLFEPGKHTSRRGTEDEPGTGFGLPLVKKMIEHYGGHIEVASPATGQENGSEFRVILNLAG